MVMSTKLFATYINPILKANIRHLKTIRIGTKALSYWPYRFFADDDSQELLGLIKKIIQSGIFLVIFGSFVSGLSHAEPAVDSGEEPVSDESESSEQLVAPAEIKDLPAAPTLKELAEKRKAEEETLKKLAEAPVSGPYDEYNRSTPRSSLIAFILAVQDEDFERAVNYLDLRNLAFSVELEDEKLDGVELVKKLLIVGKRAMKVDLEELSDHPKGHLEDGLPSYRDRITTLKTKEGPVDILMQRVPRGDGAYIWKISNATVSMIPELDAEFGYGLIGNRLSEIFPHYVIYGFEVWQIVLMIALVAIGYAIAFVVTFIAVKFLHLFDYFKIERIQKFIVGPLRFLITILFFRATFDLVAPSLTARAIFEAKTFLIIALLWIMIGVVDLIMHRFADRMRRNGQHDAVVLLRPAGTGIKLIIIMMAVVSWMDNLGYEVTTAGSGEKAVELIKNDTYDLLILDMIMPPGMDGLETYRQIIDIVPNQRAVIASGYAEDQQIREMMKQGCRGFIQKPFSINELSQKIMNVLGE